jgi:hypothetical protein
MITGNAVFEGKFYTTREFVTHFVCRECGGRFVNETVDGIDYIRCNRNRDHKGFKKMELSISTLTGISLADILKMFDEELDPEAYKPIPGVLDFTDVLPAWRDDYFNKVFGVAGFGWWYDYDPSSENITQTETKNKKGNPVYICEIKKLSLWFRMVVNGEVIVCGPVPSSGYNENNFNRGDAFKGAVTSAMGKASSRMGWQLAVYKGARGHANVTGDGSTEAGDEREPLSLEGASLFVTDRQALLAMAVAQEELSPIAQRLLLGMLSSGNGVGDMRTDLGDDVAKSVRKTFSELYKRSGLTEPMNEFCDALIGKTMEKLTYGEFCNLWDSVASIAAKQSTRDQLVRMYQALRASN